MCEPSTLGAISIATTVLSTGMQMYGQMQQGKAQQGLYEYQAVVARNNAIAAGYQADDALKRGQIAEDQQRQKVRLLMGRQRAALAGNGVEVDSGSALDITSDTAGLGEFDALTIRSNAEREAYGYRLAGANSSAAAGLLSARGDAAASAGMMGGMSSLLSGAGSVADKWYNMKRQGVF